MPDYNGKNLKKGDRVEIIGSEYASRLYNSIWRGKKGTVVKTGVMGEAYAEIELDEPFMDQWGFLNKSHISNEFMKELKKIA